jgi:hypothetical protein
LSVVPFDKTLTKNCISCCETALKLIYSNVDFDKFPGERPQTLHERRGGKVKKEKRGGEETGDEGGCRREEKGRDQNGTPECLNPATGLTTIGTGSPETPQMQHHRITPSL